MILVPVLDNKSRKRWAIKGRNIFLHISHIWDSFFKWIIKAKAFAGAQNMLNRLLLLDGSATFLFKNSSKAPSECVWFGWYTLRMHQLCMEFVKTRRPPPEKFRSNAWKNIKKHSIIPKHCRNSVLWRSEYPCEEKWTIIVRHCWWKYIFRYDYNGC
jgi:hypothetical protein